MSFYIKTEKFNILGMSMEHQLKIELIDKHKAWVLELQKLGLNLSSGYLVSCNGIPGGGGLLVLEAESFKEAQSIIKNDPMIISGAVEWTLQEWIHVAGEKRLVNNHFG